MNTNKMQGRFCISFVNTRLWPRNHSHNNNLKKGKRSTTHFSSGPMEIEQSHTPFHETKAAYIYSFIKGTFN